MPITTKVVSSNPAHGDVYSIQLFVIKFFSDLRQVCGFLRVLCFHPRYNRNIVEINNVFFVNGNPIMFQFLKCDINLRLFYIKSMWYKFALHV